VPIVIIGESKTFTPLVRAKWFVPISSLFPLSSSFFFYSWHEYTLIHTYIHTYVRANVPRVAFAMQNSSARRSLIMHSVRQRCATIESPRHALQRARSSARVDFPRYIYFHDGWSFASSYSRTRFCSEEFVEQWLFTGLFLRDGLKETLNCRIVVLLLAIF